MLLFISVSVKPAEGKAKEEWTDLHETWFHAY